MWDRTRRPDPPSWGRAPWTRPRVLIEHGDPVARDVLGTSLSERGYDVLMCAGPADEHDCPLLRSEPCPAVEDADVVVTGLLGTDRGRRIAQRIREDHPDHRMVVEATEWMARQCRTGTADVRLYPMLEDHLAATVDTLSGRATSPGDAPPDPPLTGR